MWAKIFSWGFSPTLSFFTYTQGPWPPRFFQLERPLTETPLADNDHAHAYLPFLRESALQNKNLARTSAILSSMGNTVCHSIQLRLTPSGGIFLQGCWDQACSHGGGGMPPLDNWMPAFCHPWEFFRNILLVYLFNLGERELLKFWLSTTLVFVTH